MGKMLRPRLGRSGRSVRLLDQTAPVGALHAWEELSIGSLCDPEVAFVACRDIDAVVHLAAQSLESTSDEIIDHNIRATLNLLDAAARCRVPRVVLASSHHAVGYEPRPTNGFLPASLAARPDTLYGWSKAATEAAARLYHDRYGIDVICLRIGSWRERPIDERTMALWLSPNDGHRLVEASLACPGKGFRIIWGISANSRRFLSLDEGYAIGYVPIDDSESYAGLCAGVSTTGAPSGRIGGSWCNATLGLPMTP